jgi:predicted NBD/HSP70 family sugar kinase
MSTVGDGLFLGVDVGGSTVEAVVTDRMHRVLAHGLVPTDASSAEGVVASAVGAIRRALAEGAGAAEVVAGIGLGVPGEVDADRGLVRFAMNLNIDERGLDAGRAVGDAFGLRVALENDVRAAAVGAYELFRPTTPGLHTLVYLSIGTGISAGVVVDGRLRRGTHGLAGEIGHVVVVEDGPECRCGLRGCLEAVAAGPAIGRMWPSADGKSAQALFGAAAEGRPEAVAAAAALTSHLTQAVQWLALAHEADLVVLGGGVGSVGGPLLEAIRARVAGFAERSALARRMVPANRVTAVPTGHPTGAIGAAAVARERLGADGAG